VDIQPQPHHGSLPSQEWITFLEKASAHASSAPGRQKIIALQAESEWATTPSSANLRQEQTREAFTLLQKSDLWSALDQLEDPSVSLERLARGAILDLPEWHLLRRWLKASEAFRTMTLPELPLPQVRAFVSALPQTSQAVFQLERLLTPEGELSEGASPRLQQLSGELRSLRREISNRLESLSREYLQKGVLQGEYTDVRDGRYVLPVKISSQHEVPGLVYEASASRQTVFIEPREVTEVNNRLRQKQNDWMQEVHRILTETARTFSPQASSWRVAVELLVNWDAIHARAAIATQYHGLELECGSEEVDLPSTAHPLLYWSLDEEKIQRNSLHLEKNQRALLITGPNTGGKTVLLKTLGMAAIFARTGFFFPTDRPGKVPFFRRVFTDLGDTQSIESQLSSFSGHLVQFREILDKADTQSLVLLDELNSATDPEEGAALSRALLESLLDRGCWIVTTTHDPVLKSLGRNDARILTAAMAFDEASRMPTYRLELGVPGRSRALETAERLGIPTKIIERARSFLSTQHREWESWVKELETQVLEARLATQQAQELREEAEKKTAKLGEQIRELEAELKMSARKRIRQLLEQAQEEIRKKLDEIQQAPSRKIIESSRHELVRDAEAHEELVETALESELRKAGISSEAKKQKAKPEPVPAGALQPGSRVRIPKWKSQGTVLEVRPGGQIKVAMGTIQMMMKESEVEAIEGGAPLKKAVKIAWNTEAAPGLDSTLDVRGMRLDEALSRTERYLESVFSSSRYAQVNIVHGLGTGALREGIRKLLHELPFVSDFRDGGTGGGGTGATIVELVRK
jgi:DNA mismatch repair protein MutS2